MATELGENAPPGGLQRAIGPKMLLLFIVGDILGAGIYAISGRVAGEVGGAAWVPFAVAFVLATLTAASYAELVGKYPQAAGAALYTNRAFKRPFLTFMVAFTVMASGITSASTAALAFGGRYLQEFVTLPTVLVALGFVLLLALVNFRGVRESMRVNAVFTLVELSGLIVILVIGAIVLFRGDGEPGRALQFDTGTDPVWLAILGGSALAFFALLGFEDSVNMAEEAQEPHRNYPRVLFAGLAITGTVYLAVAFVSTMVVPVEVLKESTGPLLEVVHRAGVDFPPELFALIALLAVSNTALMNMLMASRLVYGMSRERVLPSALGAVHPGRRTPWTAIVFTTLLAVLLIVSAEDLAPLAETTVLLLLIVFAIVNVSVLVLRRQPAPEDRPHFRTPTFAPVLGAIACVVLASPLTGRSGTVYLYALVLLGLGAVLWVVNRFLVGRVEFDPERLDG
jgi:APA family basic amino acid/polyamine antiporter